MRIHLEGMGVVGSLLANRLDSLGVEFTWHDIDLPRNAWEASTGAIYPGGSTKFGPDEACWRAWHQWHKCDRYGFWLEPANYVFSTKNPPHQGRYPVSEPTEHGLRLAGVGSLHLNAQRLVLDTREIFKHQRRAGVEEPYDHYVITHGFGLRLGHVYWGWTRLVQLEYDEELYGAGGRRPCFYFRPNKFQMAYAYPVPRTDWWYAGSSIIKQRTGAMRELDIEPKYKRWEEMFLRLAGGAVEIRERGPCLQGWRPAARDDAWLQSTGKVHSLRPLWNSGIRHFPYQWASLAARLGLELRPMDAALLVPY